MSKPKMTVEPMAIEMPAIGKDEMNLAEFPISALADRLPKDTKTLVFTSKQGQLTITGSDAYGLPTATDADVIVALLQLTKQKTDFAEPTVNFTRYELIRLLGWANEGKSYRRIDQALNRWVGVTLFYDNCWWDNRAKKYGDAKIHILEDVIIMDGTTRTMSNGKQQTLPLSSFTWNKKFMESFQANNLKDLDVETYFSLEHAASKRLFRFLDKLFHNHRLAWTFDLEEIAFERVGLSRNYGRNVGKIKEKLQPAIDELEARHFLEPMARDERYFKDGKQWKIRFLKHAANAALPAPAAMATLPPDLPVEPMPPLIGELTQRGVTATTAAGLVEQYAADQIASKIAVFDWMVEQQDKRVAKSPAGYLYKSIRDDYAVPKGFVSAGERQCRADAKQAADQAAADDRRQRQERDAKDKAEKQAIAAYWANLTPPQQAQLDAAATAEADPDTLAMEKGPFKRMGQQIRRDEYIRRILQSRTDEA